MYYEYSDSLVSTIVLSSYKRYDYSSYSSYYNGYYDDFTYYFKIPKKNYRYLYLSILPSYSYSRNDKVEIGVSGLAVWIIAVIVVAAIIIIGGIITTIICCRRRKYRGYIAPVSGPIAPYSSMASPYPNVY